MIKIAYWTISCGARELILDKTSTPEEIIQKLQEYWIPGFYFFTQPKDKIRQTDTQAEKLAQYIKTHNLGKISETPEIKVRKVTKAWMWTVDKQKLREHKIA